MTAATRGLRRTQKQSYTFVIKWVTDALQWLLIFKTIVLSIYLLSLKLTTFICFSNVKVFYHIIIQDVMIIFKFVRVFIEVLKVSVKFKYIAKFFLVLLINLF